MASQLSHGEDTVNTIVQDRKPCLGLGKVYHRGHQVRDQEASLVNVWRRLVGQVAAAGHAAGS